MCVAMRKIHETLGRRALLLWWTFKLDQLLMKHLGEHILSFEVTLIFLKYVEYSKLRFNLNCCRFLHHIKQTRLQFHHHEIKLNLARSKKRKYMAIVCWKGLT